MNKQIKEKEMHHLAIEMSKAISDMHCARIISDEKQLEAVLKANGWHKQSEECEKIISNQREELHRLNKHIVNLTQSRNAWKEKAKRVGKQLNEALNKQGKQEWISVEDRLPELYTSVLVYTYNGYHCVWWRGKDNDWHAENTAYDFKEVTHWMPLPEAPKMKGAKTDA